MEQRPQLVRVGRIGRSHGVRGEVKLIPEVDDVSALSDSDVLYIGRDIVDAEPFEVESIRSQHSRKGLTLLVKLSAFSAPEAVAVLRGSGVYVDADAYPMSEDEMLVDDLIGYDVRDERGELRGHVTAVLDMPAHLVFEVTGPDGRVSLVPAVDAIVGSMDHETREIRLNPIDGLFD